MTLIYNSLKDILRHKFSSAIVVITIAISVFLLIVLTSFINNISKVELVFSKELQLIVFTDDDNLSDVYGSLKQLSGVHKIEIMNKEAVLRLLETRFNNNEVAFTDSIIPSLILVNIDYNSLQKIQEQISKIPKINDYVTNTSWFENLKRVLVYLKYLCYMLIVFILCMCLILFAYASRLNAIQRISEISVLKLCGATNFYIRFPYIISGFLLGLIGSFIAVGSFFFFIEIFQGVMSYFSLYLISGYSFFVLPNYFLIVFIFLGPVLVTIGNVFSFLKLYKEGS